MIAVSSSGKSFRALASYLVAGHSGHEQGRIAWSVGRNLPTEDPELAARFMRATAAQNVRVERPVYHLVIAFDPGDPADRASMERVADRVLQRLGLGEHEAVIAAHRDRAHPHLHVLVNRVHPETGKAWDRWRDQPAIQAILREEERALGFREVPGRLAPIAEKGREPRSKLGHVAEPGRTIEGVTDWAPTAERDRAAIGPEVEPASDASAALTARVRAVVPDLRRARSWAELEARLAVEGVELERRGSVLHVRDGEDRAVASRVSRDLSLARLQARLGAFGGGLGRSAGAPEVERAAPSEMIVDGMTVSAPHEYGAVRSAAIPSFGRASIGAGSPVPADSSTADVLRHDPAHAAPGEVTPRVAELARKVEAVERAEALIGEHRRALQALAAARARLAHVEAVVHRAQAAMERFERSLAGIYADPMAARSAFGAHAIQHGIEDAARVLRAEPERFGALVTVEHRRALGLATTHDDGPARVRAREASTLAREAWYARDGLPAPGEREQARAQVPVAVERERTARERLPDRGSQSVLTRELGRALGLLLPRELEELRRLLTSPQFAIAVKLREATRDAVLGWERE